MFENQIIQQNLIDSFNKTALCTAIENKSIEIVKLLLTNEHLNINAINRIQYRIFK